MKYYKSIVILLFTVLSLRGSATAQQPYFQEEITPSALSEIKLVTGIAADKNGCIWFTTQTGIYRFDGTRVRHYSVLNTPVLKFERITLISLLKSKNDTRWSMTDSKGNQYEIDSLSRLQPFSPGNYAREQVNYKKYSPQVTRPFEADRIDRSINKNTYETHSTPATGMAYLIQVNGDIIRMPYPDIFTGAKGSLLYSIKKWHGNKAIATDRSLYVISNGSLLRWKDNSPKPESVQLSGDIVDKNKSIDFDKLFILKTVSPNIILLWQDGSIYEVIGSENSKTLSTRLLIRDTRKELPYFVLYSPAQHLFISYFLNQGLVFYRAKQFSLMNWEVPGTRDAMDDYYYSLLPENKGFLTVMNSGLVWLGINGEKQMLARGPVSKFFLFKDRYGNIWYSLYDKICYLEHGSNKNIILGSGYYNLTGGYQFDDSTYYLLTDYQFRKFILKNGNLRSQELLYTAPPQVQFTALYAINPGSLWLGSDRGLIEFSLSGKNIKWVKALDSAYIRAVTMLAENNYLIGTYDKGIYQYKNNSWMHLSCPGRTMPASAHAFITDKLTSSVWVSSNEGLLRFSLSQLLKKNNSATTASFGQYNNFGSGISTEFNGSSNASAAMLSDSCIAFANAKGIVTFNPLNIVAYPLPSTVLAEPVEKPNDSIHFHNPYQIEFSPVVPYFGNLQDLVVLYHLTNSDDNWHKLSGNSTISYNNVSPGKHVLQFRVRNYYDSEDKEIFFTLNSFTIPYRWYQQLWFKIVASLFILFLVLFIHNLRIWYLKKRKIELEKLIKRKTSELQETNENLVTVINELSESEASLKQSNFLKDEYYAVLTHDLRSPLKFLSFNLSQLLELLPELTSEAMKKGLFTAYQTSNDVYKLVDEFIYWIQDNEKQLQAKALPTVINAVITDIKKLYEYSFESNGNSLLASITPELRFSTDPRMLFIVLRNAVDNANKYTTNGTITISAAVQNITLQLIVADTGRGMNSEMVQELTDLQYKKEQLDYKQRKSLGFYIMAMLIKKMGGSYTITSVKGEGTSVCFMLPELTEE